MSRRRRETSVSHFSVLVLLVLFNFRSDPFSVSNRRSNPPHISPPPSLRSHLHVSSPRILRRSLSLPSEANFHTVMEQGIIRKFFQVAGKFVSGFPLVLTPIPSPQELESVHGISGLLPLSVGVNEDQPSSMLYRRRRRATKSDLGQSWNQSFRWRRVIWAWPTNFTLWNDTGPLSVMGLQPHCFCKDVSRACSKRLQRWTLLLPGLRVSSDGLYRLRYTPPPKSAQVFFIALQHQSPSIMLFLDRNGRGLYSCRDFISLIGWCGDTWNNCSSMIQYLSRGSSYELIWMCPSPTRWSGDYGDRLVLTRLLIPATIPLDFKQAFEFLWREHVVGSRASINPQSDPNGLSSALVSMNGKIGYSRVSSRSFSWTAIVPQSRYQYSFCWGQKRSRFPSSFSKEKFVSPLSSTLERTVPPSYFAMKFVFQRSKVLKTLRAICVVRSPLMAEALDIDLKSIISETFCQKFPVFIYRYSILYLCCSFIYVASEYSLAKRPPFVT